MTIRQLLTNQSGQFWGGFLGGLNSSMKEGRDRADKQKELELRKKQIDAQIKGMNADNEIKQHKLKQDMTKAGAMENLAREYETGTPSEVNPDISFEMPSDELQFTQPDNKSLRDQMVNSGKPATGGDPRSAAAIRAGYGAQVMRNSAPKTAGSMGNGVFGSPQAAIEFMGSDEYKRLYPNGGRVQQGQRGWTIEGINPVNDAMNVYHRTLQATGSIDAATAAANHVRFGSSASTGAGTGAGRSAQELGEPIQPMVPFAQPAGTPQRMPQQPQPQQQSTQIPPQQTPQPSYPSAPQQSTQPSSQQAQTARPGESQSQRAARLKAEATGMGTRQAEAREGMVGLADAKGMIDELDLLSQQAFKTKDGAGYMERAVGAVGQHIQSYDSASAIGIYEARKQTVGEKLARTIGGVKGAGTEGDIFRMLTALPKIGTLGETESSRKYKIAAFNEIVMRAMRNQQAFIDGQPIDLNQSRAEFKGLVDQFIAGKYVPGQLGPQSGGKQGRLTPIQGN